MKAIARWICDVCGNDKSGEPEHCPACALRICTECWITQGRGKGHLEAEHGNERRRRSC